MGVGTQRRSDAVVNSLATEAARKKWAQDPVAYLQAGGFKLSRLPQASRQELASYLQTLPITAPRDPPNARDRWIRCTSCRVKVGATLAGVAPVITAVLTAACAAQREVGPIAAAAAVLEGEGIAVADVGAVAAETGLPAARVARIFATAFAAGGVAGFLPHAVESICQATGACR